jgi:integrase
VAIGGHQYETRVKTKAEGRAWVKKKVAEFEDGELAAPGKRMTLSEWLRRWVSDLATSRKAKSQAPRSPKTIIGYEKKLELYVIPTLGSLRLDQLTSAHISRLHEWMAAGRVAEAGIVLGKGVGVSPSTISATHIILRAALQEAVDPHHLIRWNPAGKPPAISPASKYHAKLISIDQWRAAINAAGDVWGGAMPVLAATMGLRRGEISALRWQDIYLDDGYPWLWVSGSLQSVKGQGLVRLPPKNATSDRQIAMPEVAASFLRARRQDAGYVVSDDGRSPVEPSSAYRRSWVVLRERIELPPTARLHDLRHFVAYHQHLGEVLPLALQSGYFGHSVKGTTLGVYVAPHLRQDELRDETRKVASVIDALYNSGDL